MGFYSAKITGTCKDPIPELTLTTATSRGTFATG